MQKIVGPLMLARKAIKDLLATGHGTERDEEVLRDLEELILKMGGTLD